MTKIVVGVAEQVLMSELRVHVSKLDDAEIVGFSESTHELVALVARLKPDVAIVHDLLGPGSPAEVVREISFRTPATAVLVVNSSGSTDTAMAVLEAGAKGVLSTPLDLDDVISRMEVARGWAERMGGLLAGATADVARELGRNGRVTTFTGAKGGVGTTTVATHMAIDLQRQVPGIKVCLVDLDLQAGDVSGILEARQRVSVADVAKVSQDLSTTTITDALVRHESGVSLLLTPLQVHETDFVTPNAVRAILGLLRQEFDVVLVDGGAHVTPAQAAAVEVADEVVCVVTPDVLAMRSFRRSVQAWEGLGVRSEQELHILVNRVSRDDVLNAVALGRLTSGRILATGLPSMHRHLERAVNARNPDEVRETVWWSALQHIGAEVGVHSAPQTPQLAAAPSKRRKQKRKVSEAGQIALETVALVPVVVGFCLLVWQVGLTALAFTWNGHAANAAARAHSIGENPRDAAKDAMPESMRSSVQVTVIDSSSVRVSSSVPVLCPGCASLPRRITQVAEVVKEP
ncbi:AAA family ATPase [Nocardioides gilvus]|uniref:AAA family ATPase n=1 Tax=Nocardioides gilvus TaxID=1735589 RepID=UPI000D74297A|nr:AAA family ATPase [Nocardioides gilvus]